MDLVLKRYGHTLKSTGGALSVIASNYFAHTCEDEPREIKVHGETRISAGRYKILLRPFGGMHERYKKLYPFHKGMLHLQNIDDFEWVYIHPLKNEKQTDGCIGVGYTALSKKGFDIDRDVEAYTDLYKLILKAIDRGEDIWITITDD